MVTWWIVAFLHIVNYYCSIKSSMRRYHGIYTANEQSRGEKLKIINEQLPTLYNSIGNKCLNYPTPRGILISPSLRSRDHAAFKRIIGWNEGAWTSRSTTYSQHHVMQAGILSLYFFSLLRLPKLPSPLKKHWWAAWAVWAALKKYSRSYPWNTDNNRQKQPPYITSQNQHIMSGTMTQTSSCIKVDFKIKIPKHKTTAAIVPSNYHLTFHHA